MLISKLLIRRKQSTIYAHLIFWDDAGSCLLSDLPLPNTATSGKLLNTCGLTHKIISKNMRSQKKEQKQEKCLCILRLEGKNLRGKVPQEIKKTARKV